MTLREYLASIDKRKNKVTLYRLYGVATTDKSLQHRALKVDTSSDIFAVTPEAAFEYIVYHDKGLLDWITGTLAQSLANGVASFSEVLNFFSMDKDAKEVDIMKPKLRDIELVQDGLDTLGLVVYLVAFNIPVVELERLPPCYNLDGVAVDPPAVGPDMLVLTLRDREFTMDVNVYHLSSIAIKFDKNGAFRVKDLKFEEPR